MHEGEGPALACTRPTTHVPPTFQVARTILLPAGQHGQPPSPHCEYYYHHFTTNNLTLPPAIITTTNYLQPPLSLRRPRCSVLALRRPGRSPPTHPPTPSFHRWLPYVRANPNNRKGPAFERIGLGWAPRSGPSFLLFFCPPSFSLGARAAAMTWMISARMRSPLAGLMPSNTNHAYFVILFGRRAFKPPDHLRVDVGVRSVVISKKGKQSNAACPTASRFAVNLQYITT